LGEKVKKWNWKTIGGILAILAFLLPTSCAGLVVGGALAGGGVAGYYAHEKGWLSTEKKEVEEKDKEEGAEKTQEVPQETKEKKSKREIGCILPF
jgi:succinate dehydrogenase/fumarate reductase flavoprotein subunit